MVAQIQVKGTVVHATHDSESGHLSCVQYRIRLESGRLLIATAHSSPISPRRHSGKGGLTSLYNSAGSGVGHVLSIGLDVSNPPEVGIVSVEDLGVDPSYPVRSLCRDQGILDSLPIIGVLRGNQIRTPG